MLLNYMIFWSVVMMMLVGLVRLRSLHQFAIMGLLSAGVLLISWMLANQLASGTGLDITLFNPLIYPELYIAAGPAGWMILMVMPCGWLAPILGANAAERWGFTD
ncbi:MAG: hypothetical protein AAF902_05500 [Chloroflexota bacterium]